MALDLTALLLANRPAPAVGEGGDAALMAAPVPATPAVPSVLKRSICAVVLAPRVVTVLPGRDDLRVILDKDETNLVEIRIRTTLDLTAEDLSTIAARGFTSATVVAATLRIPRRLAWKIPCAREALRLTICPDAVIDQRGLSLDARVTSLDRPG